MSQKLFTNELPLGVVHRLDTFPFMSIHGLWDYEINNLCRNIRKRMRWKHYNFHIVTDMTISIPVG